MKIFPLWTDFPPRCRPSMAGCRPVCRPLNIWFLPLLRVVDLYALTWVLSFWWMSTFMQRVSTKMLTFLKLCSATLAGGRPLFFILSFCSIYVDLDVESVDLSVDLLKLNFCRFCRWSTSVLFCCLVLHGCRPWCRPLLLKLLRRCLKHWIHLERIMHVYICSLMPFLWTSSWCNLEID